MKSDQSNMCLHSPVEHYHPLRAFLAYLLRRKTSLNDLNCIVCDTPLKTPRLYAGGFLPIVCLFFSLGITYGAIWLGREAIVHPAVAIVLLFAMQWLLYRVVSSVGLAMSVWEPREDTVSAQEEWDRFRAAQSQMQQGARNGALLVIWHMAVALPMSVLIGLCALVVLIVELVKGNKKLLLPCAALIVYAVVSFFFLEKVFAPIVHLNFILVVLELTWNYWRRKG